MSRLAELVRNNQYMSTIDTSRNVKPDKPKGYLVNTPLYTAPVEYLNDLKQDAVFITKGWKGKANDYELGRQNDIGMKLGGLAIASYLAATRISKLPKLMEFVGLGSFLTSLSLWPKLAVNLPLKIRTGVDIDQKYVDSYGRKKKFYGDSQYLAWDLYNKAQITKIGDKMGVPKDVPNREEVIKEKARKLAVQGNTLALATAGFAAPIMSGLICKGLEPVIDDLKFKHAVKSSDKVLKGKMPLPDYKEQEKAFNSYLTENLGRKISPNDKLISKLNWSNIVFPEMSDNLHKDLAKIINNTPNEINEDYVDLLYKKFGKEFSSAKISKDEIINEFKNKHIFGSQIELYERYKAFNNKSAAQKTMDALATSSSTKKSLGLDLQQITGEVLEEMIDKKNIPDAVRKNAKAVICNTDNINSTVNSYNYRVLDSGLRDKLDKVFHSLSRYFQNEAILNKWEKAHHLADADSFNTYIWKKGSKTILSALNLSGKELKAMTLEGDQAEKIIAQKIKEIASDSKRYKKTIAKIANVLAEHDRVFNADTRTTFRNYVTDMCHRSAKELRELGFNDTAGYINDNTGSLKDFHHIMYDEKVLAKKSPLYRFIQALDLERRFQLSNGGKSYFEQQFDAISKQNPSKLFRPRYETTEKIARKMIMSSIGADHKENLPKMGERAYNTVIRILYGALPDKLADNLIYQTIHGESNEVAKALDTSLEEGYKASLKAGADKVRLDQIRTGLATDTIEALNSASNKINHRFNFRPDKQINLVDSFKTYFQTFIENVVNPESKMRLNHNTKGAIKGLVGNKASSLVNSLTGETPVDFAKSAAKDLYKDKLWLKKFGIAGAVLFAGTIIITKFFGNMSKEEMYMTNKKEKSSKAV